jgi:parallel beta-helix repeat protein
MAKTFLTKKNNAKSTITDNPLLSGATILNVQTGDGSKFPDAPFHATLYASDPAISEIVKVTVKSTDQFTIERAKENTTAQEWPQGTRLELLVTAKLFDDLQIRTEITVATDGSGDYNCDGTDDQTEINEAISNLPAGGGIVQIKKGTYNLTGVVEILKSNVVLEGEGSATLLRAANASNLGDIVRVGNGGTTSYQNVIIRKFMIDGNQANQTSGASSPLVLWGASSYKHSRITVENMWLTGAKQDCLKVIAIEDSVIRNNFIYSNIGTAIGLFTTSQYISITGNILTSNSYGVYDSACNYCTMTGNVLRSNGYGFYVSNGWRETISGNTIFTSTNYGVYLIGSQRVTISGNNFYGDSWSIVIGNSSNITRYNVITGNVIAWPTSQGIALYYGSGTTVSNVITGNHIFGAGGHGIYLYASSYNTITGNAIDGSSRSSNNTSHDIYLSDNGSVYSTYNVISSNNLQATQANKVAYHIRELGANDDYNLVIGNICKDGVTGQINLQGANSVRGTNIPASG